MNRHKIKLLRFYGGNKWIENWNYSSCIVNRNVFASGQNEEVVEAVDGLTIRILPQCDAPVDEDSALVAWQEAYLEEKLGYPVNFEFMYLERKNLKELLNLRLASGDIPDVFQGYPDSQIPWFW